MNATDRVGIGWRPELAADIFVHLERIDVVEVVAETHIGRGRQELSALRALGRERALLVHGVSLGLASSIPVDRRRLDRMARFIDAVEPQLWSEHLAFVRAGGIEIGHMAAPPRTLATIDGAIENVRFATRIVGAPPALENIATLIDPPASQLDEAAWTRSITRGACIPLLLDLHNLYANAVNFGNDPHALLRAMPLERIACVHISGGRWIEAHAASPRRLLDDHVHDVPDAVFALLRDLASWVAHPLTVVLERDGSYPRFDSLLRELDRARTCLRDGRLLGRLVA